MTRIYLIRHAEAEGNLYRIAQGQDNSALTDRGWRQVRALERRFADTEIDAVYASDLYRTCATASAIYKPRGLPLHRRPELREICVGVWERRTWGEIYRRWPEEMRLFRQQPYSWRMEGAETAEELVERVLRALERIAAENEEKTVAVFCHGYAIRLALARLQDIPPERVGETPTGDNTAVSLLEGESGALRVVFRDDNSHLKTAEFLAGEKVRKRANGLEPGLWYQPLKLPEQEPIFLELAELCRPEDAPFDRDRLLVDAETRTTLAAYRGEEPVGLLQMGPEAGQLALLCVREDCRSRGYGTQLIGQAVQRTRAQGGGTLWAAVPADSQAGCFLTDQGFCPGGAAESRTLWEKSIRLDPEFL